MNYLLLFTIGPVQPFIEKSRKARDMYAGSKILSEIMRYAISIIEEKKDINVIFPVSRINNIPNRFIAEITNEAVELEKMATELTKAVREKFLGICMEILFDKDCLHNYQERKMVEKQIDDFLEVHWLFEAYKNDESVEDDQAYKAAYSKLFENINAIKSLRRFSQIQEPRGRKCMLFPEYNAIFVKKSNGKFPNNTNTSYMIDVTKNKKIKYLLKENEALSALAMVKRLYLINEKSISSIKYMLLKNSISNYLQKDDVIVSKIKNYMSSNLCDGFADALYDCKNNNLFNREDYNDHIFEDAKTIWDVMKMKVRLSDYYALLKFDGDNMGTHFINKTKHEQKILSKKICDFAEEVPEIIREKQGMTIYAGGEDFFGILPLDTLFNCLETLDIKFREKLNLTFSAGIAIAHVMQPLKHVVSCVEQMEQRAKNKDGKSAFAIGILKRSGDTVYVPALKLKEEETDFGLSKFCVFLNYLIKNDLPNSFVNDLQNLFRDMLISENSKTEKIVKSMIQVVLNGKQINHKSEESNKVEYIDEFFSLLKCMDFDISKFLQVLNSLSFLAREVNVNVLN